MHFANSSSNSETRGPRLRLPDRRTRVTESISRSPISGCESGMFTQHPLSQKQWREFSERELGAKAGAFAFLLIQARFPRDIRAGLADHRAEGSSPFCESCLQFHAPSDSAPRSLGFFPLSCERGVPNRPKGPLRSFRHLSGQ